MTRTLTGMHAVRGLLLAGVVAAGPAAGAVMGESGQRALGARELPRGTRLAETGDGRVVGFEPGGRLTIWGADGHEQTACTLRGTGALTGATTLRASPSNAVLCGPGAREPFECTLIDLRDCRVVTRFGDPAVMAKTFTDIGGWIVEEVDVAAPPVLRRHGLHGDLRATMAPPAEVVDDARAKLGSAGSAVLRPFIVRGELWAVPIGVYEFWRLDPGPPARFPVPTGLRLVGNLVTSGVFRRQMASMLACGSSGSGDPATQSPLDFDLPSISDRRQGSGRSGPTTPTPAQRNSFFSAIRDVAVRDDVAAVLVEPFPEKPEGGCRLDLWRFPAVALTGSVEVPGACPSLVAVAPSGVWVRCGPRVWLFRIPGGPPAASARGTARPIAAPPGKADASPRSATRHQGGRSEARRSELGAGQS